MRLRVLVSLLILSCFGAAQSSTSTQSAPTLLQRSLAALSWTSPPSDVVAIGTIKAIDAAPGEVANFVQSARRDAMRYEVTIAGTTTVTVVNGKQAARLRDGSTSAVPVWTALSGNVPTLPFYGNFATGFGVTLNYLGAATIDGEIADSIDVIPVSTLNDAESKYRQKTDRYKLWISRRSGLILQIAYTRLDGSNPYIELPYIRRYSDYRSVGGYLFPFRQLQYLDGQPQLIIDLTSVRFDSGIQDSTFAVSDAR